MVLDARLDLFGDFLLAAVKRAQGPLYLAIADAIGQAIQAGVMAGGDRLPPQRYVADLLQLNLTTVTRAYAEAQHRGLLEAQVGRGTFVKPDAAAAAPALLPPAVPSLGMPSMTLQSLAGPSFPVASLAVRSLAGSPSMPSARAVALVDMSMNLPPQPQHPALRALLQDSLAALLSGDMRTLMTYRTGAGSPRDRDAAARWLQPLTGTADPERVVVCAGAQAAMTALLSTLVRPGDTVLTEPLIYPGFRALAAQLGLRLVAVPADASGLLPDALDRACRDHRAAALYCVPTIHNPTTVTMPLDRRQAVAEIARGHGVPIVEDDAYGMLPARRLPALTALVAGSGYHVASLSKCLSPGLRTAFVTTPGRTEASRLVEAVRATTLAPSPLLTGLVTHWMESGAATALCTAIRQEAAVRQEIARAVLAGAAVAAHPEGLHIWLTLPAPWHRTDFIAHVRERGLALVASDSFAVAPLPPNAVRVCLGVAETRDGLRSALLALAEALRMNAPTHLAEIV